MMLVYGWACDGMTEENRAAFDDLLETPPVEQRRRQIDDLVVAFGPEVIAGG